MFFFSGSLLAFLHEIQLANATLRFGIRKVEDATPTRQAPVAGISAQPAGAREPGLSEPPR
jgi:hypothetical protein